MRILIPIDGSSYSDAAVALIAARAAQMAALPAVELLNVQCAIPSAAARFAGAAAVREYHAAEAAVVTEPALAALKKVGLKPRVTLVVGHPATEVAKAACAGGIDLVVMGSHGHTGIKKLLFGSVTSAVLAACTTPLLVLRGEPRPAVGSMQVGIALDGSAYGVDAVRYVIEHRSLFGPQPMLHLLHVVVEVADTADAAPSGTRAPTDLAAAQQAACGQVMAPARALIAAAHCDADPNAALPFSEVCLIGTNPGDELAAYADTHQLDLLLIGSHGDGAMLSALLGSVATRVAAKCSNALLFIQHH